MTNQQYSNKQKEKIYIFIYRQKQIYTDKNKTKQEIEQTDRRQNVCPHPQT
jgi:hypothetical protein